MTSASTALPVIPRVADQVERIAAGRFPALGTELQGLELVGQPPWRKETANVSCWRRIAPGILGSTGFDTGAGNLFARARNAFCVRVSGDSFTSVEESSAYQAIQPVANSLEVRVGHEALFVFAFELRDVVVMLGRPNWGLLKETVFETDFIISGAVRDASYRPSLVELRGCIRKLQPDDDMVGLLRAAKSWRDI